MSFMGNEKILRVLGIENGEVPNNLDDNIKGKIVKEKGWYIPSIHEKYTKQGSEIKE